VSKVIIITGAATGIGRLSAEALAKGGHTVYATMRDAGSRNRHHADALRKLAEDENLSIYSLEMDILSDDSVENAVTEVLKQEGRIDVLMQNAGHLVLGPTEAFSPDEITRNYQVNVAGAHRVSRAVLPIMRGQEEGLIVWISSTTVHGGFPPFLGPYAAAKAAMDSMAGSMALEVSRFGIETVMVTPGAFTVGTDHFPKASAPEDQARAAEYARYDDVVSSVGDRLSAITPPDAHPQAVADEVLRVVDLPHGARPFRTVIDFVGDGAEEVSNTAGLARRTFLARIGLEELLVPNSRP
jgi:NAD(P)-dependent dehydrogenase (short-subunit alcohol dehydrogenase family)